MNPNQDQCAPDNRPTPKWAVIANDTLIPMPGQHVREAAIREQAGIQGDQALLRDHNSNHDPVMPEGGMIDLAEGNVFYSVPKAESEKPWSACAAPAKLAYVVDDVWEEVIRRAQTGLTLRDLFGLVADVELLRDRRSPDDEVISDRDDASFDHGCVFRTRKVATPPPSLDTKIIVNGRERTVTGKTINFERVVVLAFGSIDPQTIYTMAYAEGPASNREGKMVVGDVVEIKEGMVFNVTITRKS
jgi:hypothetical protein